jgi:putative transposase
VLERRGSVWADRYHRRDLASPREVRAALVYVLMNRRKHTRGTPAAAEATGGLDPCSSAAWFDGWSPDAAPQLIVVQIAVLERFAVLHQLSPPVVAPSTWLLRTGWRRRGLVRADEAPALR